MNNSGIVLGSVSLKNLSYSEQPSVSVKASVNNFFCDRPLV